MRNYQLLIIDGHAGAGKTTIAREYAMKHDFAFISEDVFTFDFNPAAETVRKILPVDEQIGFKNMVSVLKNYMLIGKDIILEGALVNTLNRSDILNLAKKHQYQIIGVTMVADEKVRRERQKQRGYVLPVTLDRKLARLVDNRLNSHPNFVIDTTEMKIYQVVDTLNRKVNTIYKKQQQ